jgi:hypothetical protein
LFRKTPNLTQHWLAKPRFHGSEGMQLFVIAGGIDFADEIESLLHGVLHR